MKDGTIIFNFGELGEIYGRVVCARGSFLISPVMFTLL